MKKITSRFIKFSLLIFLFLLNFNTVFSQCSDQFLQGTSSSNGSGYNWADAFRASCSGKLEYVQFYANNGGTAAAGTLKIYNGAGVSTTPVYTQAYPSFSVPSGGVMRVDLTGDFNVVMGNQYTFSLYVNGVNIVYYPSFNIYPGGGSWQNGTQSYKHNFKVGIIGNLANETFDVAETAMVPNPSNGNFTIRLNQPKDISVEVYNILGKRVFSAAYQKQDACHVSLDMVAKGLYFVRIDDGGKTATKKMIVQ